MYIKQRTRRALRMSLAGTAAALSIIGMSGQAMSAEQSAPQPRTSAYSTVNVPDPDGEPCTGVQNTDGATFDFTGACTNHDACYGAALENDGVIDENEQKICDDRFLADMNYYCNEVGDPLDGRHCLDVASLYWAGVRACGNGGFICP